MFRDHRQSSCSDIHRPINTARPFTLYHKSGTSIANTAASTPAISKFPPNFAPPLVVIGVGVERLVETAELDEPAVDEVEGAGAEVNELPCADDVVLDEAADPEEAGGDDVATETLTDDDVPGEEEVAEVADNVTTLLDDGVLAGADDEVGGDGVLELAPALGTGATTPPWDVPPDCVVVPAALDL
jgi:hypothetical protein